MFLARRAPSPPTQATSMYTDFLDFFLTPGHDGQEEKSSWTSGSSELLDFPAIFQQDISYSHVDKDLRTIQDPFYDIFSLDISTAHEDILTQGPEGNRVPQDFPGIPGALPDFFQYGLLDWGHGGTFDGLAGCEVVPANPPDSVPISPAAYDISDNDEAFLDQLRQFLQTNDEFPPVLSVESTADSMDTRPPSGVSSIYSLESEITPTFYSYSPPMEIMQEIVEDPLATSARAEPQRKMSVSRRPYVRKYAAKAVSPNPSIASTSSSKKCTKVTPKKRKQNRKAAGDYRRRKRLVEDGKMRQHEDLLKVRDELKEQRTALEQELKFAMKMVEAKMKRLASLRL